MRNTVLQLINTDSPRNRLRQVPRKNRVGIVVDATCDLPAQTLVDNNVIVLPVKVRVDDWQLWDTRNDFDTVEFFRKGMASKRRDVQSLALDTAGTRDFLNHKFGNHLDDVIQVSMMSKRADIYMNSLAAGQQLMLLHNKARRQVPGVPPFGMWVLDSESLFAGTGLIAYEAMRMADDGHPVAEILKHVSSMRHRLHVLVAPNDLYALHARASAKGDRSVSWLDYKLGTWFNKRPVLHGYRGRTQNLGNVKGHSTAVNEIFEIACTAIRRGLDAPLINVSYAGPLDEVESLKSYQLMHMRALDAGYHVLLSPMSIAAGINVGARALSLAFASSVQFQKQ
jgi:DegV family protein with EDD domain